MSEFWILIMLNFGSGGHCYSFTTLRFFVLSFLFRLYLYFSFTAVSLSVFILSHSVFMHF